METMKLWFQMGSAWELVVIALLGIGAGITLRRKLPKAKLMALFIPMLVYMYAEYKVTLYPADPPGLWIIIGGAAACIAFGAVLPSIFTPWEYKRWFHDDGDE